MYLIPLFIFLRVLRFLRFIWISFRGSYGKHSFYHIQTIKLINQKYFMEIHLQLLTLHFKIINTLLMIDSSEEFVLNKNFFFGNWGGSTSNLKILSHSIILLCIVSISEKRFLLTFSIFPSIFLIDIM